MTRRRQLLILFLVALAARAVTLGNPIVHNDEQFYFVTAQAMTHGAWPYVDVWDRKPVGLFLLYMPAAALPLHWGVIAYQAMALLCSVATAWMIARAARLADWRAGGMLAAIAYLLWINLAEGQGGQSPIFYNVLMVGAALLIAGTRGRSAARGLAAMALVGLALQIKYSAVFEGVFFGLWIVWQHWQAHRRIVTTFGLAAALIAVALLPTAAAIATFAAAGHLDAFWYANFQSILERRADPWREQLGNFIGTSAILSPLVAMAGVTLTQRRLNPDRVFLFGWLASALLGFLVFGSWFDHYALPVMVPAAVCAAGAMGTHRDVRRWAVPILIVVAVVGQGLIISKRFRRGSPAQFAAVVDAVGRGPGCLWVYSGETMIYPATGRCAPTRYLFPSHLTRLREAQAIGVDPRAEIVRIFARRPAVIVIRTATRGERPDIRAMVLANIAKDYRQTAALPVGNLTVRVFKRR